MFLYISSLTLSSMFFFLSIIHRLLIPYPDFRIKVLNKIANEDSIAVEIEFSGTNTGPLKVSDDMPEIPATNKKIVNHGCYFGRVKNGKFTEINTYPDMAGMMVQLGLQQ